MILGGGGCCFIVHVPVLKEKWNLQCPSVEMDRLPSNVSSGGSLGSAYGGIRNCGSSVEAEHVWPVWDRQEQCAAERPLASGTSRPFHPIRQMPAVRQAFFRPCPWGWMKPAGPLPHSRGDRWGDAYIFLAAVTFFRSLLTCHLLGEAFPDHSFYSSHTPALIIHPLSLFFSITFITTDIAIM